MFTPEQKASFQAAAEPMIQWLAKNLHPHAKVIIDSSSAELVEGSLSYVNPEHIPD